MPTLKNQENKAKRTVMTAHLSWFSKAVSMISTRVWHLETVLQLKTCPPGLSALWSVCVLRSQLRSGLWLRGYSGEQIHSFYSLSLCVRLFSWWHSSSPAVGWFCFYSYPLPSRRRCGGGASTNQNCRAALRRIQRFLRGTEALDGGEVTSDETSSTPDYLDSLRAMKPQPGGDGVRGKRSSLQGQHRWEM